MYGELIDSVPELAGLLGQMQGVPGDCSFEEFETLRAAFEECLSPDVMRALMLSQWHLDEPLSRQDGSEDHLVLWNTGERGLVLRCVPASTEQSPLLFGSPGHAYLGLVGPRSLPSSATLDVLVAHHDAPYDPEIFDPSVMVSPPKVSRVAAGSSLAVQALRDFYALMPSSTDLLILMLVWNGKHRYRWDVSVDSRRPKRIVCVDDSALRAASSAKMLGRLPAPGNVESLNALLAHPDHNVRWEATRALCQLDRSLGLKTLERVAAGDPHPHVRLTARGALDALAVTET